MNPADIRRSIRSSRGHLSAAEIDLRSQRVFDRFLEVWGSRPRLPSARVALYRPLRGEPRLELFRDWIARSGFTAVYPRTREEPRGLEWRLDPDSCAGTWARGGYGISEPDLKCPLVDPASLDLILVPGVAFGESGERLGRGAGFYDRALPMAARALRLAFTFDFQLFPALPQAAWDQQVDWIFTENRVISSLRSREWLQNRAQTGRLE